ncbi:ESCO1/2 acetyl-transferase-domain-containing protein [Lipomyces arxii]|uniref:ESCO1/2 acetyl-transferase-domain-containing protein n=1 Tax=Lipomyces arxii TaxID=56418 RepID=UPI0034CDAC2C
MPLPPRSTYSGRRRTYLLNTSFDPSSSSSDHMDTIARVPAPPSSPPLRPQSPNRVTKVKPQLSLRSEKLIGKVQAHLALSKRPQRTTCAKCGMSYDTLSPGDLRMHNKFHARAFSGVNVSVLLQWSSVGRFRLEGGQIAFIYKFGLRELHGNVSLRPIKQAIETMLTICNAELSAPNENVAKLMSRQTAVFVCISKRRNDENLVGSGNAIIGLCLVERAARGYFMSADTGRILASQENFNVLMGVSRIYTAHSFRRMGVAAAMLNAACHSLVYGLEISRDQVAWSQPSDSGCKVATRWCSVKMTEQEISQDRQDQSSSDGPGVTNVNRKIRVYFEPR